MPSLGSSKTETVYGAGVMCGPPAVGLFLLTDFLVFQVWVADRGNKRLQVFDKDTGEWLGAWDNCFTEEGPSAVR